MNYNTLSELSEKPGRADKSAMGEINAGRPMKPPLRSMKGHAKPADETGRPYGPDLSAYDTCP